MKTKNIRSLSLACSRSHRYIIGLGWGQGLHCLEDKIILDKNLFN